MQHVPRTRDLEHHGSQPMSHEVVHVTGDPTPLAHQRLLGELAPGGVELGCQLPLANEGAAKDPREDDAQDPDADSHLGRVLDHGHEDGRCRREQSQRGRHRERLRPAPDDEGEQRDLEHQRLEPSATLAHDDGEDHGEGDCWKRDAGQKAHKPKAATGIAAKMRSDAEAGSASGATTATTSAKTGTRRRSSSPWDSA